MENDEILEIAGGYARDMLHKARRPLEAFQIASYAKFLVEQYISTEMAKKEIEKANEETRVPSSKRF